MIHGQSLGQPIVAHYRPALDDAAQSTFLRSPFLNNLRPSRLTGSPSSLPSRQSVAPPLSAILKWLPMIPQGWMRVPAHGPPVTEKPHYSAVIAIARHEFDKPHLAALLRGIFR